MRHFINKKIPHLLFFTLLFYSTIFNAFSSTLACLQNVHSLLQETKRIETLKQESISEFIKSFEGRQRLKELIISNKPFIETYIKKTLPAPKSNKTITFFDLENSILKQMNDKFLQNKSLAESINNFYKENFLVILQQLIKKDNILKINALYDDYKSLRGAIQGNRKDTLKALQIAQQESDIILFKKLSELNMIEYIDTLSGRAQKPAQWFLIGAGIDPYTANLATRQMRTVLLQDGEGAINRGVLFLKNGHFFIDTKKTRDSLIRKIEKFQSTANLIRQNQEISISAIYTIENNSVILHKDAIKILKNATSYEAIMKDLEARFNVSLKHPDITLLLNYLIQSDYFAPPVFLEKHVDLNLQKASEHGLVTADIAGVGIQTMQQVQRNIGKITLQKEYLNKSSKELSNEITNTIDITLKDIGLMLNEKVSTFRNIVENEVGLQRDIYGHIFNFINSGDDVLFYPTKQILKEEQIKIVQALAQTNTPSSFRVTFIPPKYSNSTLNIPTNTFSDLAINAEKVEKVLRQDLLLDPQIKDKMTIAIISHPQFLGGASYSEYEVLIGSNGLLNDYQQEFIRDFCLNNGKTKITNVNFVD